MEEERERINCIYSLIVIFFNYEDKEVFLSR